MSHATARHQKPSRRSPARPDPYGEAGYDDGRCQVALCDEAPYDAPYDDGRYDDAYADAPYADARFGDARYGDALYGELRFDEVQFEQAFYDQARYQQARYERAFYGWAQDGQGPYSQAFYGQARYDPAQYDPALYNQNAYQQPFYGQAPYGQTLHNGQAPYGQALFNEDPHEEALRDEVSYQEVGHHEARYDDRGQGRRAPGGPGQPRKPGAHRHARPSRMRRKPVRIAAALAGSTLLVAGAAPAAAHWRHWHWPATHPGALDQESLALTPGAAPGARLPGQPAAPQNALDQWVQIPIGKHAAAELSAAKRAAKRAARHPAPQPSHSPQPQPQPTATAAAAYQNPLRAVSGLVLERVDMGVDFGGAGPVYALGDGVITNATGDSSGWPGGGWITYQLTDGPDAGLVVYVAEDVTPTVQVGQDVTSSTVIGNMFNGADGIETGWATSDGSTAESEMPAAGGISGGGPFPTMVGLSFDAVLESVGVPPAPNANEPGNGLLPAGYPPVG